MFSQMCSTGVARKNRCLLDKHMAKQNENHSANRFAFTKTKLEELKCADGEREYFYDIKTPGLAFCVTSAGSKSFYFYRRIAGRPSRVRLGGFPELSVEQARDLTAETQYKVAQGGDPVKDKRLAKGEMTLKDLFQYYLEAHAKPHKKTWEEDVREYKLYLPKLHNRKLSQITQHDIQTLHASLGRKNGIYCANRVLALLSKMFNVASQGGYIGPNPAHGIKRFRERSRDRYMNADELRKFFEALQ
jgi:hypothetical protein